MTRIDVGFEVKQLQKSNLTDRWDKSQSEEMDQQTLFIPLEPFEIALIYLGSTRKNLLMPSKETIILRATIVFNMIVLAILFGCQSMKQNEYEQ